MRLNVKNSILILVLVFITALLSACGKKTVPEYKGMVVSETFPTLTNYNNESQSNNINKLTSNENPFGNNTQTIEDKLKDYLVMPDTTEIDFYPTPNMDIYLTIKLNNPSKFEIASFTLNESKYLPTDLQVGSDHENLILLINVGDIEGFSAYTVDKIMYNEGKETKEVTYTEEKTINLGIKFTETPFAGISNKDIRATTISFNANVYDKKNIIEKTGNILKAVIYDGTNIISDTDIKVGANQISFDKLHVNSLYQIALVTCYDLVDGQGLKTTILQKEVVQTKEAIASKNITSDTDSIAFDIDILYPDNNVIVSGIEVYKGDTLVQSLTEVSELSINDLLSKNSYTVKVLYTYNLGDGTGDQNSFITFNATTKEKREPTFYFHSISTTKDSISFAFENADIDETGGITSIGVYQGTTLIKSLDNLSDRIITGLLPNSYYTIKAKYTYDLNDGTGVKVIEEEQECITLADIEVTNIEILNIEERIESYENIKLRITLKNLSSVSINRFTISGQEVYLPNSSNASIFILTYRAEFAGGNYIAIVEEIGYEIYGENLTIPIDSDKEAEIFILGSISEDSIYNDNDNILGLDTDNYIYIKLINPTGYDIQRISIYINSSYYSFEKESFEFISNELIKIPLTMDLSKFPFINKISVSGYSYGIPGDSYYSKTIVQRDEFIFHILSEIEYKEISSSSDLLNIESYNRYQLKNDIDLAGINWEPLEFNGIIQGNGYKIKNLTIIIEESDQTEMYVGLFSKFKGLIEDVHLENISIDVSGDLDVFIGGFVGEMNINSKIINSSVTGKIKCDTNNIAYVGGIAGYSNDDIIKNNHVNISFDIKANNTTIGGIVGYALFSEIYQNTVEGSSKFVANENTNIIIGGIVGYAYISNIKANIVLSEISVSYFTEPKIGGVCGKTYEGNLNQNIFNGKIIINSYNNFTVTVGGMSGFSENTDFVSNLIMGDIIINTNNTVIVGGIVGELYNGDAIGNVYGGNIEGTSPNEAVFVSSITVGNNHSINPNLNYVLEYSSIKTNNNEVVKIGEEIYTSYLDQVNFYLEELGWDVNIWDLSNLNAYNGIYPVLK